MPITASAAIATPLATPLPGGRVTTYSVLAPHSPPVTMEGPRTMGGRYRHRLVCRHRRRNARDGRCGARGRGHTLTVDRQRGAQLVQSPLGHALDLQHFAAAQKIAMRLLVLHQPFGKIRTDTDGDQLLHRRPVQLQRPGPGAERQRDQASQQRPFPHGISPDTTFFENSPRHLPGLCFLLLHGQHIG